MRFNNKVYFDKLRYFFRYIESVYLEVKNLTLPSYYETFRFTFIISLIVIIISFFLWLFDLFFVRFLSWLIF